MKYDVTWREDAYLLLAKIWGAASDKTVVMRAVHAIDSELSEDAPTKGESRVDGRRVLFAPPLAITFRVSFRLAEAEIVDVWTIRPHQP